MSDFRQDLAELSPDRRELLELLLAKRGMRLEELLVAQGHGFSSAPLSFTQERLWASGQLATDTAFGNLPLAFVLTGALDCRALERSVGDVLRRHAILRTVYPVVDGRPRQRVLDLSEVVVQHEDLEGLSAGDRLGEAKRLAETAAHSPINTAEDIPLRVLLIRLDERKHLFVLVTHHLATDGWGARVLLRDLSAFYESRLARKPVTLQDQTLQYADFAVWQRDRLRQNVLSTQLAYWERQLAGAPAELTLPTDRSRPSRPSLKASSCQFGLSASTSEALRLMSRREGVTLYTTLLAAFKTLLHLYTGRDDLVVGSTFSNRPRRETEQMVGNFGNNVLLRTGFSDRPTFRDVMKRVRDVVLDAHAHQDLPLEILIDRNRVRGGDAVPLFQTLFLLRDSSPEQNFRLPGLVVESLPMEVGMSPFDLNLDITDGPHELYGFLQCSADLFDVETIRAMVDDFCAVLEAVVAEPDIHAHEVPLCSDIASRRVTPGTADARSASRAPTDGTNGMSSVRGNGGVASSNEVEEKIAEVWKDILGISTIGVHDDFMALGGHSLLLVTAALRIEERFGVRLPRSLFRTPTVSAFAKGVAKAREERSLDEGSARIPVLCRQARRTRLPEFPDRDVFLFPASDSQRQLWFFYQLDRENPSYNVPLAYELWGNVNVGALERSLAEIVRRHETFRTTFAMHESGLVQIVHPSVETSLSRLDLGSELEEETIEGVLNEESRKPLYLDRGPLVRFVLLSLGNGRSILLIVFHHILVDHTTVRLFARELTQLYGAFSVGRPSPLRDPELHCADVSVWESQDDQQAVLGDKLKYWTEHLGRDPSLLQLPTARPRPARQFFRGKETIFRLPPELSERLRAFSRQEKNSLFVTMLAGFKALLFRYTSQKHITVGCPFANRNRIELQETMGCLVNTLPLRTKISPADPFTALLERVRQVLLGADAHQEVSFESIVGELHPVRDASHNPIFQVFFGLHEPPPLVEFGDVRADFRKPHTGTSKFDLSVWLWQDDEGIKGYIEYDTDLFDDESIAQLLRHYQTLLEGVVADPDLPVSRLPLHTAEERHRILTAWNQTDLEYPRGIPVHRLFEEQVARTPEAIAVQSEDGRLSYRELNRRSNRLAHYLIERGVGPGVLVGIRMERSLEMVVGLLGVLKAGGAYVPLDPSFPAERLDYVVEHARLEHLLTETPGREDGSRKRRRQIHLVREWPGAGGASEENPRSEVSSRDLAYVIYTSGSTGKPKGVEIEHRGVVNFLLSMRRKPGLEPGDRLLAVTTLSFDISVLEVLLPIVTGARCILVPRAVATDGAALVRRLEKSRATVMQATPATYSMMLEAGWRKRIPVKLLCGGEALSRELANRLLDLSDEVWNLYGPTETTIWSSVRRVDRGEGPVLIGGPIANTQLYVLDGHLEPVAEGVEGELYIGGDGLARGYLHSAELTAERFIPDPFSGRPGARLYRTGDRVRYRGEGELEFLGRTDHQVKIRGFRIEPGEIEAVLGMHEEIDRAIVVAREDQPGDRRLVAYYTAARSTELSEPELVGFLKRYLPSYMVPAAFVRLKALPFTPNGKVDRRALPALEDRSMEERTYLAPRDSLECQLVALWEKTLDRRPIGVADDFFLSGGHSILAAQLFARIDQVLGVNLPLATLFEAPTIGQLAEVIRMADYSPRWSSLVPIQPNGSKPPLYCVHGAGGNVMLYRDLACRLGPDQPVYGLQARGLDGKQPFLTRIEDMASHYIDEIKAVQPDGPYYLSGYCMGGSLAYEMAQQLTARGDEVGLLVFFETYNVHTARGANSLRHRTINGVQNVFFHFSNLRILDGGGRAAFVGEKMKVLRRRVVRQILSRLPKALGAKRLMNGGNGGLTYVRLRKVNDRAQLNYEPKPYCGQTVLFKPNRVFVGFADPEFGWGDLIGDNNLEICVLPVYPRGMLVEPFVGLVAERLKHCLEKRQVELSRRPS